MKLITKIILFLLLQFTYSLTSQAQIANWLSEPLDSVLKEHIKINQLKGAAASVVFPDGTKWSRAIGDYGNTQLNSEMLYEIGSNTKSMVATIILLLEEEGKLSLNDTLYKFISPIKNVTHGITIKQLLSHKSGLYNYTSHPDFINLVNNDFSNLTNNKGGLFITPDTILQNFVKPKLNPPGLKWEYCNTNYILLGYVIEAVENKKFHTVLRERILTPMGLNKTYLSDYEIHSYKEAGYYLGENHWDLHFTSFLTAAWSAGGVLATTEDLATYAYKLFRGEILSDNSLQKMLTVTPGSPLYGLGMFKTNHSGHVYAGHGGTTLHNSYMDYSLKDGFSCVTITIEANVFQPSKNIHEALLTFLEDRVPNLVNIKTTQKENITLYPNPTSEELNITIMPKLIDSHYRILDPLGKEVKQGKLTNSLSSIDVSKLSKGYYIFQIEKGTYSYKFLVE